MNARCSGSGAPSLARPSSVEMCASPTEATGMTHDRTGLPSIRTVHAPHWPRPQPNLGPFSARSFLSAYSSGVWPSQSTVAKLWFTRSLNTHHLRDVPCDSARDRCAIRGKLVAAPGHVSVRSQQYKAATADAMRLRLVQAHDIEGRAELVHRDLQRLGVAVRTEIQQGVADTYDVLNRPAVREPGGRQPRTRTGAGEIVKEGRFVTPPRLRADERRG